MGQERDFDRERFWRGVIRRRLASGLTVSDFCVSEGLKPTTYYHWHREIRRRDEEGPLPMVQTDETLDLATVTVLEDRVASTEGRVEIVPTMGTWCVWMNTRRANRYDGLQVVRDLD